MKIAMTKLDHITTSIINHSNTNEIVKSILSDPDYYNSLLVDDELYIGYKVIRTRTTLIGLASLHDNQRVLQALLMVAVPADGLDIELYRKSIQIDYNYRKLNPKVLPHVIWSFGNNSVADEEYWSCYTSVYDMEGEIMMHIPWSTPIILAMLAESESCTAILLNNQASCDFKHPYYAKTLELCENERILIEISQHKRTHMRDTVADVLTAFNKPLAHTLYMIGRKPSPSIITDIIERAEGFVNISFFGGIQYKINQESPMWDKYFKKRAEACLSFYESILL